jgi:hypothetical protein
LVIEEPENGYRILSHSTQVDDSHELVKERMYGFIVRNVGRRIATGVRFQLLKAEYREEGGEFNTVARHAFGLSIHEHIRRDARAGRGNINSQGGRAGASRFMA